MKIKQLGLFDYCIKDEPSYFHKEIYEELGVEWVNNTPEDIRDLCDDILDYVSGVPQDESVTQIRKRFNALHSPTNQRYHTATIGGRYLINHTELFSDPRVLT